MRRRPSSRTISAMAGDLQTGWGHPSVLGLVGLWWWEEAAQVGRLVQALLLLISEPMLPRGTADELGMLNECHLFILLWKSLQTLLLF